MPGLHSFVHVDYRWRLALVALPRTPERVGIARCEGAPDREHAEIAFVVNPAWRRVD